MHRLLIATSVMLALLLLSRVVVALMSLSYAGLRWRLHDR
jgi:hypothetical protein